MESKVFYSWQSDLPNATNRGFIEDALYKAVKAVANDGSIEVVPVVDRDTQDVPGSPNIADTIFQKIDEADIFVCDASLITAKTAKRQASNPNVLVELGYAVKSLGWEKVILVVNTVFGPVEKLPFDLRQRRAIPYVMHPATEDRAPERNKLKSLLEGRIREIYQHTNRKAAEQAKQMPSPADQAIAGIENTQPNQALLVRNYMKWLVKELESLNPDYDELVATQGRQAPFDDLFLEKLDKTLPHVFGFAHVAEAIAGANSTEAAVALFKGFEGICDHYDLKPGFSGGFRDVDFDFFKFLGHELFVTFISMLMRERRWQMVSDVLDEDLHLANVRGRNPGAVQFDHISQWIDLLDYRNKRLKLNRSLVHADTLHERHSSGALGKLVPMREFLDADFLLMLRGMHDSDQVDWKPWSSPYMRMQPPRFVTEAHRSAYAQQLLPVVKVEDSNELKSRLYAAVDILRKWFPYAELSPLRYAEVEKIDTR